MRSRACSFLCVFDLRSAFMCCFGVLVMRDLKRRENVELE